MNITRGAASLFGLAMLLCTASIAIAQSEPEVRRARPVDEPPVRRALRQTNQSTKFSAL